ncbi:MAG: iron ABC transporter permease [Devosia sp.]|nr:iron ABC transporter permease [Devosia sp.]
MSSADTLHSASPRQKPRDRSTGTHVARGVLLILLCYMIVMPLAFLLWESGRAAPGAGAAFSVRAYLGVYSDPATYRVLTSTLLFAAGSAAFAIVLGTVLAWLLERTDLPGRRWLSLAIMLPTAIPPLVFAASWVFLLDPTVGLLSQFLALFSLPPPPIYSMAGMCILQGLVFVPTTYLMLAGTFRNIDSALEEAALASGAGTLGVIRRVTFPLALPAMIAVTSFLFIGATLEFDIPAVIGGPANVRVLSAVVVQSADPVVGQPDYASIAALAVVPLTVLIALSWVYRHFTAKSERYVTIGGKGREGTPVRLGRWRGLALAGVLAYFFVGIVAPISALVLKSFFPYSASLSMQVLANLTTRNYQRLFDSAQIADAAVNSLVIALVAASALTVLAPIIARLTTRGRNRISSLIDTLAFLPLAVPGVLIGLALTIVYLHFSGLGLYGSVWIIALAHSTTYLAFSTRTINGSMLQISPELEEAARVSGGGAVLAFRRITLPLLRPAMLIVWVWVAAHSMRELSSALMLQGVGNPTVSTLLFGYYNQGLATVTAAGSVLLTLVLLVLVLVWAYVARPHSGAGNHKRKMT